MNAIAQSTQAKSQAPAPTGHTLLAVQAAAMRNALSTAETTIAKLKSKRDEIKDSHEIRLGMDLDSLADAGNAELGRIDNEARHVAEEIRRLQDRQSALMVKRDEAEAKNAASIEAAKTDAVTRLSAQISAVDDEIAAADASRRGAEAALAEMAKEVAQA